MTHSRLRVNWRKEVNVKREAESFVGKFLAILLTISVVFVFISIGLMGFIGVIKVGSYYDLVYVDLYPSKVSNVFYFGWLFILIYIILIFIEIIVRVLMKSWDIAQSLKKNIISYSIQIFIGIISIKILIDHYFDRVEVSFLGVSISVFILYLVIFFSSGGHKGIDDLEE